MTIDRRQAYYYPCLQGELMNSRQFKQRYQKGCALKETLKTRWHLIDQGKTQ